LLPSCSFPPFSLLSGTQADVTVGNTANTTKVTVETKDGAVAKGWASRSSWPKDNDEWRRWVRSAIPWVAGAAIVLAAATSMKRNKDEEGLGRKARRAGNKAGSALDDLEDRAERNWFGLKRNVEGAADEAGNKLEHAKNAAARKVRCIRIYQRLCYSLFCCFSVLKAALEKGYFLPGGTK
jgi:hypothetical protein